MKFTRVETLKPGDYVDLEGDKYADPEFCLSGGDETEHPEWNSEYEIVVEVKRETLDCIFVEFESGFACGFPFDHEVKLEMRNARFIGPES